MLDAIRNSGLRFVWLALIVIVLDQWTKQLVLDGIALHQSIQLTGFFNLTYVRNYGAAFSFLSDAGGWQVWFFSLIAFAVSAMILWWLKGTPRAQILLPVAFSLILGGAIGNVYDRLTHGFVVDFLDFYWGSAHFPAFNVADSAICLGAFLLIVDMFKNKEANNEQ